VHDPANRALIIGDATLGASVLFADGRAAFPPTYRDVEPYVESIRALRDLDADLLLTAHYPVYEGEGVTVFLDESAAYTERIDEVLTRILGGAEAPRTTLELVRVAGAELGPWPAAALDYAVFPVTGNLERLAARGAVTEQTDAVGRRRWSLAR
jgi:glyoxylase-like metal-dependent hydrolase (beta-lactamase superfamily II)